MSIRLNPVAALARGRSRRARCPHPLPAQTKLLRFPDIAGDRVAFCYAGDIWTAPAKGGNATRLTAHPGLELFPKFSPDGKWIAFTGQYEGDEQVYVIPAEGGEPRQLTYYPARGPFPPRGGYDNQVMGWTPDGDGDPLPLAARRRRRALGGPALHRPREGRPGEGAADADVGRGRLLARRQAARLLAALPRLPHLEALRGRLGAGPLRLRPRHERREAVRHQHAHRARPDVDRRRHLLRLRPRRHAQPLRLRPGDRRGRRSSPRSTTWDVRWPSSDNAVAHRLRAERRAARLRRPGEGRPGDPDLRARTTASRCVPRATPSRRTSRTSSSARRASGRCSWRAATSSRCRSRRARRATSPPPPASTTSWRAGRPTASGSRSSPTRAARTRSGSSTRRAASRSSSRRAARA